MEREKEKDPTREETERFRGRKQGIGEKSKGFKRWEGEEGPTL